MFILSQRIGNEWLDDEGKIHPNVQETICGEILSLALPPVSVCPNCGVNPPTYCYICWTAPAPVQTPVQTLTRKQVDRILMDFWNEVIRSRRDGTPHPQLDEVATALCALALPPKPEGATPTRAEVREKIRQFLAAHTWDAIWHEEWTDNKKIRTVRDDFLDAIVNAVCGNTPKPKPSWCPHMHDIDSVSLAWKLREDERSAIVDDAALKFCPICGKERPSTTSQEHQP